MLTFTTGMPVACYVKQNFHRIFSQALSTSSTMHKAYEQWPYEKIRRVGRSPNKWRGQGGKKSRIPYDKRYPLSGKDINESTEGLKRGGNKDLRNMIGEASKVSMCYTMVNV